MNFISIEHIMNGKEVLMCLFPRVHNKVQVQKYFRAFKCTAAAAAAAHSSCTTSHDNSNNNS